MSTEFVVCIFEYAHLFRCLAVLASALFSKAVEKAARASCLQRLDLARSAYVWRTVAAPASRQRRWSCGALVAVNMMAHDLSTLKSVVMWIQL